MTWYVWWWYLLVSKEARCLLQPGAVSRLQLDAWWSSWTFERNDHDSVWLGCHYKTVGSWEKGQLITACLFVRTLWSFADYLNCCHWFCWNLELSWISDSDCLHTKQLYFLLPLNSSSFPLPTGMFVTSHTISAWVHLINTGTSLLHLLPL